MNIKKTYNPIPFWNKLFTRDRNKNPMVFAGFCLCAGELGSLCGTNADMIGMQSDPLFTGSTNFLELKPKIDWPMI